MEWQPMNTAPSDVRLEVGRYDEWRDQLDWRTTAGVCFEKKMFRKIKTYYGKEYTHWRYLPEPPKPNSTDT